MTKSDSFKFCPDCGTRLERGWLIKYYSTITNGSADALLCNECHQVFYA